MNSEGKTGLPVGHIHPITHTILEIQRIFAEMGFQTAEGPEIETEYYNFDALRIPKDHPARDMQDTFWLKDTSPEGDRLVARTQTSNVQIRFMEEMTRRAKEVSAGAAKNAAENIGACRIIVPGKVFRNEATDATHEAEFFQVEGLCIDKNISLANLKGTLQAFFKKFIGESTEIRFRASYFPFVEPGVEVDIKWRDAHGKEKWLEVMGAGLVHPDVLRAGGYDPEQWQGFAFGMGLDRLVMLRYGIDDIRLLYSGDLRFVNQF